MFFFADFTAHVARAQDEGGPETTVTTTAEPSMECSNMKTDVNTYTCEGSNKVPMCCPGLWPSGPEEDKIRCRPPYAGTGEDPNVVDCGRVCSKADTDENFYTCESAPTCCPGHVPQGNKWEEVKCRPVSEKDWAITCAKACYAEISNRAYYFCVSIETCCDGYIPSGYTHHRIQCVSKENAPYLPTQCPAAIEYPGLPLNQNVFIGTIDGCAEGLASRGVRFTWLNWPNSSDCSGVGGWSARAADIQYCGGSGTFFLLRESSKSD